MLNENSTPASTSVMPDTFSSLEVSKMTGVSLRQLQWWDEQGVVSPMQRGHRRMYQLHEVVEVSLITELRQAVLAEGTRVRVRSLAAQSGVGASRALPLAKPAFTSAAA